MLFDSQLNEFEVIRKALLSKITGFSKKTFLITGATGLIGRYLVYFLSYLDIELKIIAVSRNSKKLEKYFHGVNNVEFIECDLNNGRIDFDYPVDVIIHAASNSDPYSFSSDPVGTMKTNLLGTSALLDFAVSHHSDFLFISTGEVYGNRNDYLFKETDLGSIDNKLVRSCYPESKRAAETLCISYGKQFNLKVRIARLCYVYGPYITDTNSRADAQFLRNALKSEDIVLKSQGLQKRTYCYIADAVCALFYILNGNEIIYNVSNRNSVVSLKEYANVLAKIAGVKISFELSKFIEDSSNMKHIDLMLESTKLENLGWRCFFDLESGIKHTFYIARELMAE